MDKKHLIPINEIGYDADKHKVTRNVISPSSVPTFMNCTGSILLPSRDTVYAKKGRDEHEAVYYIMKSYFEDSPELENIHPIEDESLAKFIEFVEKVYCSLTTSQKPNKFMGLEIPITGRLFNYKISGFIDLCVLRNDKLFIIDYKSGFKGMKEENYAQLYIYALLFYEMHPFKKLKLGFIQKNHKDMFKEVSLDELFEWKNDFINHLNKDTKFNVGPACEDCYKSFACPALSNKTLNTLENIKSKKKVSMGSLLEMRLPIEKFYKNLKGELLSEYYSNGNKFKDDSVKLVKTKKSTFWKDEDSLPKKFKELKTMSVSQAKKKGLKCDGLFEEKENYTVEALSHRGKAVLIKQENKDMIEGMKEVT